MKQFEYDGLVKQVKLLGVVQFLPNKSQTASFWYTEDLWPKSSLSVASYVLIIVLSLFGDKSDISPNLNIPIEKQIKVVLTSC